MEKKNFITQALEELHHVVWPTEKEARTYLSYNVWTIVVLALLLAVMGFLIRSGLSYVRSQFPHEVVSDQATQQDLDDLIKDLGAQSGAVSTSTGLVSSGSVTP